MLMGLSDFQHYLLWLPNMLESNCDRKTILYLLTVSGRNQFPSKLGFHCICCTLSFFSPFSVLQTGKCHRDQNVLTINWVNSLLHLTILDHLTLGFFSLFEGPLCRGLALVHLLKYMFLYALVFLIEK